MASCVCAWAKRVDCWGLYSDIQETVKVRFDEAVVPIPYAQRDLRVHQAA